MKEKLLSYLKCIKCNSPDLKLDSIKLENEEIVSGKIMCSSCHENYLIKEGIPVMLLKAYGYKVKGCLGQISRGRLKCDWLADLYDMIMYHILYLAETIIGTKKVKK